MRVIVGALILAVCCVGIVGACPVRTYTPYYTPTYTYSPPVVTASVVVPTVLAVPVVVAVPTYGAGYIQPVVGSTAVQPAGGGVQPMSPTLSQNPMQAPAVSELDVLKRKIAFLESRLGAVGAGDEVPGKKGAPTPQDIGKNGLQLFQQHCSRCHDASVADKKGKGLSLTKDGSILPLTEGVLRKITTNVYLGKMPKDEKLNDETAARFIEWVDQVQTSPDK